MEKLSAYLDYNAGRVPNPNSIHMPGIQAKRDIDKASRLLVDKINGSKGRIIWTSSGSMANILSLYYPLSNPTRVISSIEHKSVKQFRHTATIPCNGVGIVGVRDVIQILDNLVTKYSHVILSIMAVNNETGAIQPIETIGNNVRKKYGNKVIFHVDACQALQKIDIDVEKWNADLVTFSAYKVSDVTGLGALWAREGVNVPATQWYMGTPNTEGIKRFGMYLRDHFDREMKLHQEISTEFQKGINSLIFPLEIRINGPTLSNRIHNTINLRFKGVNAQELAMQLENKGIYTSTGSACSQGNDKPSEVLLAMGLTEEEVKESLRLSWGPQWFTREEIREICKTIRSTYKELRTGSLNK